MAVVNTLSTLITNADAKPKVMNPQYLAGSFTRRDRALVSVAAADSDTSVYRITRIPSSAILLDILVANDAITGGTQYDLGLYLPAYAGGTVVDQDLLGTLIDMSSARAQLTSLLLETTTLANAEKRIWELLALSSDPKILYDLCWTAPTVGSAAGKILTDIVWRE